MSVNVQIDTCL